MDGMERKSNIHNAYSRVPNISQPDLTRTAAHITSQLALLGPVAVLQCSGQLVQRPSNHSHNPTLPTRMPPVLG